MAKSKQVKIVINKPETDKEKEAAVNSAIALIEKNHGKGSVMKMGEKTHLDVDVIPTGSLALDLALGVGGVPRSRIIEIFGAESSGKTTLALHIVAEAQKRGGVAGYVDAEHALDPVYAKKIGVDIDNLYISQPDTGEQGLDIAEIMVRSGAMDVIVVDSVAALVPKCEIEGSYEEAGIGVQARMMSKALRKLTTYIGKSNSVVIFINQVRQNIGMYGPSETTTGGRALKFYSSIRLDVKRKSAIKLNSASDSPIIGALTSIKVVKNKVAPPFNSAEIDLIYGEGFSHTAEIFKLGVDYQIIAKSGAWYSYNGEKIGQGASNSRQYLKDHPDKAAEIEEKIKAAAYAEQEEGKNTTKKKSVDEEITEDESFDENVDSVDFAELDFDEVLE